MRSKKILAAAAAVLLSLAPVTLSAQTQGAPTSQQERMKDCNKQAGGLKGDERKTFMANCLKAKPATAAKECKNGKPCGNTCIAMDKVCRQ